MSPLTNSISQNQTNMGSKDRKNRADIKYENRNYQKSVFLKKFTNLCGILLPKSANSTPKT